MMEILISTDDWKDKKRRLHEIMKNLHDKGWEKFGHDGTLVLFKDVPEVKAFKELKNLKIDEIKAESWEENDLGRFLK